jgi:hypothetical protein
MGPASSGMTTASCWQPHLHHIRTQWQVVLSTVEHDIIAVLLDPTSAGSCVVAGSGFGLPL